MEKEGELIRKKKRSKFKESLCDELIDMASRGRTEAHFRAKYSIPKSTFYDWKERYPEFKDATDVAESAYEAFWVERLTIAALSPEKVNQALMIKMLEYSSEKARKNYSPSVNVNINTYSQMSPELRQEKIRNLLEKARENNDLGNSIVSCIEHNQSADTK